jgi:hypothetical protein
MYMFFMSPIKWLPGAVSPGVKRPWREADHSAPSSVEVKNTWRYTSAPQYVFMACYVSIWTTLPLLYVVSPDRSFSKVAEYGLEAEDWISGRGKA